MQKMNSLLVLAKKILPFSFINILRRIRDFYQWDIYYQKSWSQEGEDLILSRYFENIKTKGFYVDVGAHHPLRFSNTYKFYKQGWHGINIDAMPGSMDLFNKLRPRDINLEKAVSDSRQIMTYYAFNEPAFNGFSKDNSEQQKDINGLKILFRKEMKTVTLAEILDSYMPKGVTIDFMSIDIEGLDFSALRSNDFTKYRPTVILIEILKSSLDILATTDISIFLTRLDYSTFAKTVNTVFFIDNKFYKEKFGQARCGRH